MSNKVKQSVLNALEQTIKSQFLPAGSRVYTVSSLQQYLFASSYKTPGVAIIYRGGPFRPQKGQVGGLYTIFVDVWAFQTIWKQGDTVVNESENYSQMGLLQLEDMLMELLDANLLANELPTGIEITSATITGSLGTQDFPKIGSDKFSGAIGINIQYKVFT